MNNFGVFEIASAKTTLAPGWAYVPDTGPHPSTIQPTNRKRARNAPTGPSISDLTARQEARIRKEVEALERDGNRDNTIPIPVKAGRKGQGKTSGVRKILQSQKTFTNHLDDFLAFQQAEAAAAAASANSKRSGAANRNATTQDGDTIMTTDLDGAHAMSAAKKNKKSKKTAYERPLLLPPDEATVMAHHAGDEDPLLMSRVPEPPSEEEVRALLVQPPLTYLEARGGWGDGAGAGAGMAPARVFCEVCGYWGRVRCMKCGTRVCALDCLETHREECVTRYGL